MKKVLILRMDKIGDLLCTLPIDQILNPNEFQTHWVISKGLGFLAKQSVPPRSFTEVDKANKAEAIASLKKLIQEFKPDVAVSIQCPWWVNYTLWKLGVPVRGGVLSKIDSFLFLNKGLRQKRSLATQHECDYSRELLEHALDLQTWSAASNDESPFQSPYLTLKAEENSQLLDHHSLKANEYFVVHPGMAGSALNWPQSHYVTLIQQLKLKHKVVITGTPADEPWLTDIKQEFHNDKSVLILQNKLKMSELLMVLASAKAVIAPSTGVIHLAAGLGTPVVGFYSPIRVQHPRRWMPRGASLRLLFMPDLENPEEATPQDMAKISVESVVSEMKKNQLL